MADIITLQPRGAIRRAEAAGISEEIHSYGTMGPIRVALCRRTDIDTGELHVVVVATKPEFSVDTIAKAPDDEDGRRLADLLGTTAVRAVEMSETAFMCEDDFAGGAA